MALDQGRHLVGMGLGDIVAAALHDMQPRVGQALQQGASTHNLQRLAKGMGWGGDDSSSVLRVYETMLQRKVKK